MSIHLDIADPNVKEKIAKLPENMLDWAEEVLLDQARLIAGLAQVYCPVDTGSLRDSIRVERGGRGAHWREIRVRAGGYITRSDGRPVNYALFVEQQSPYLGPAVEQVRPTIGEMIKANVVEKANE